MPTIVFLEKVHLRLRDGRTLDLDVREGADVYQRALDGFEPFTYLAIVDGRVYRDVVEAHGTLSNGARDSLIPDATWRLDELARRNEPEHAAARAKTVRRIRRGAGLDP